jgi:predicted MFS family arabinose efflux permease
MRVGRSGPLGDNPGFRRFWVASTVSGFGTSVTTLALQVLIVVTLHGSATDVGLVSAARWLPYLLLGVVVSVLADRVRRQPVLVATDLARAALLVLIPVLAGLDALSIPVLIGVMALFGLLSLANDAVHQSFLPRLVPRASLAPANARLEQSNSAAQSTGPVLGGALVSWIGAPFAVLVDAVSYAASGLLTAAIRVHEPRAGRSGLDGDGAVGRQAPSLVSELREGLAWVYRHRMLMPLAVTTHVWFLFYSVLGTVYAPFVLRSVGVGAFGLGVTLALAGVGGVVGATASTRIAIRIGVANIITGSWLIQAVGFAAIALTPALSTGPSRLTWMLLGAGQLLIGLGFGAGGPIELSYRQGVTPDRLQGRMNTTMRSLNRAAVVVGAPLGGLLADSAGYRTALWTGVAGIALTSLALRFSHFRHSSLQDEPPATRPVASA